MSVFFVSHDGWVSVKTSGSVVQWTVQVGDMAPYTYNLDRTSALQECRNYRERGMYFQEFTLFSSDSEKPLRYASECRLMATLLEQGANSVTQA